MAAGFVPYEAKEKAAAARLTPGRAEQRDVGPGQLWDQEALRQRTRRLCLDFYTCKSLCLPSLNTWKDFTLTDSFRLDRDWLDLKRDASVIFLCSNF